MAKRKLFEKLYNDNFALVHHYAYNYIYDNDVALDIAQEVFISAWNNWDKIEMGKEKNYVITITRNKCLNVLKHNKVHGRFSDQNEYSIKCATLNFAALEHTSKEVYKKDIEVILFRTMKEMSPIFSTTFDMSRFKCLKNDEIAKIQKISIRTVEYRIKKALMILQKALIDYV